MMWIFQVYDYFLVDLVHLPVKTWFLWIHLIFKTRLLWIFISTFHHKIESALVSDKTWNLSLKLTGINYWLRFKKWKIFLSNLSKTFRIFCVFFSNSLTRDLFKNGLDFFLTFFLNFLSIFENLAVLKTYDPVPHTRTANHFRFPFTSAPQYNIM